MKASFSALHSPDCLLWRPLCRRPLGADIPDAVKRAASLNASSLNGVLVEERHIDLNVSAGPAHYSAQSVALVLLEDGQ